MNGHRYHDGDGTMIATTTPAIHQAFPVLDGLSGSATAEVWTRPAPHSVQKLASSLFSFPHLVQNMAVKTVECQEYTTRGLSGGGLPPCQSHCG